jgi:very-short-patch-repair endonuclease
VTHASSITPNQIDRWQSIRAFYEAWSSLIIAAPNEWACAPYDWECAGVHMTPIEIALWSDIRMEGGVFYPQYPVGRFLVDFANPGKKVVLECDGAAYHLDRAKDLARDEALRADGWAVYRFTGSECMRDAAEVDDAEGYRIVMPPVRQRLRQIINSHGLRVGAGRNVGSKF